MLAYTDLLPVFLGETEFQRIKTRSLAAAQKYLREAVRTRQIEADTDAGFSFEHYKFPIGQLAVSLLIVRCDGGVRIVKHEPNDKYLFEFPLHGDCHFTGPGIDVRPVPGDMFVVLPAHPACDAWGPEMQKLMVEVSEPHFVRASANEVGEVSGEPPLVPVISKDLGVAQWLQHMIGLNLQYEAQNSLLGNARVGSQLERTLLSMLFAIIENSNMRQVGRLGAIVPYYVRRAEAFIKSRYAEALTIEDIAAAAYIGPRSLYYGFKQALETTPMAYLRQVRLGHARRHLEEAAETGRTIAEIAVEVGFVNFSHFSKLYRRRFGESPTDTVRQSFDYDIKSRPR